MTGKPTLAAVLELLAELRDEFAELRSTILAKDGTQNISNRFVKSKHVMRETGLSRSAVQKLISTGRLQSEKFGGQRWIYRESLQELIAERGAKVQSALHPKAR